MKDPLNIKMFSTTDCKEVVDEIEDDQRGEDHAHADDREGPSVRVDLGHPVSAGGEGEETIKEGCHASSRGFPVVCLRGWRGRGSRGNACCAAR